MRLFVLLAFTLLCLPLAAGLLIEDFDYPSDAAAQAVWEPASYSTDVSMVSGESTMILPCLFTQDVQRAYWDRDIDLDLTGFRSFRLEIFVPESADQGSFSFYFRSGAGWYATSFTIATSGWNVIDLGRGDFHESATPDSWSQIDGIRISIWNNLYTDTAFRIREISAAPTSVLLTEGFYQDNVAQILDELGLRYDVVTEAEILAGELTGASLLMNGYQADLSDAAMDVVDAWVDGGGRVIAFYHLEPRLEPLLGFREVGYNGQDMRAMHFDAPDIVGLPETVSQGTWNIIQAVPDRADARVIATWETVEGTPISDAAWLMSDTGAWMSHVLLRDGGADKRQMLLAIMGHFAPQIWEDLNQGALDSIGQVGPHTVFTAAVISIEAEAHHTPRLTEVQEWLTTSETLRNSALAHAASGEFAAVNELASDAREALRRAYYLSQVAKTPEIRAVWESSGTGPYPGDWDRTAAILSENGFNAVMPIIFSGGMAHYESAYLPSSETYATYGDVVAECIEACHAHGVEVHVRRINWRLLWTEQSHIDAMRAAGRTQVDLYGADVDWLCPSDPRNRDLEIDVMLETVQRYDVDGINLDYIRYPDRISCYCEPCRTRFEQQTGNTVVDWPADCYGSGSLATEYNVWRVENITSLVRRLREEMDQVAPEVEISADVFSLYPSCRFSVAQDWVDWIDEGLLDFICPMDYRNSADDFEELVTDQIDLIQGRIPMAAGIGVIASNSQLPPDQAIWQAAITREQGIEGFVLFGLRLELAEDTLPAFGLGLTKPPGEGMVIH